MGIRLQSVHKENFEAFGSVLEFPKDMDEPFCIIVKEEKQPWRLAVFRYTNKSIKTLECHPHSMESFEPLGGVTVLLVAEHDTPEKMGAFILDKPICLHKGIWHQVLSLTDEAQVKIAENLEVVSEFYHLDKALNVEMV